MIVDSGYATKIVLFGSRARCDHRDNSDFDLAIEWIKPQSTEVLQLKSQLIELPLTLYKVDLIDLNNVGNNYQYEISHEGRILWQKKV